ncbi:MAG: DUF4395 domain-containing protein [Gammaproteobacteria bacterium]|nr:DUF4395 domain-containing protein [Gammaproteobacteria bacterium]
MAKPLDHAEIKTGQLITMFMCLVAGLQQDMRWLVVLGAIFLVTGLYRPMSPFVWAYRWLVQPLGLMKSDYRIDNIQPHSFGQLIGALTAAIILGVYYLGYGQVAWALVLVLFGLTLVSYLGWCIGCFLYYQLHRLGLRGFFGHEPTDKTVFPGQRPRRPE